MPGERYPRGPLLGREARRVGGCRHLRARFGEAVGHDDRHAVSRRASQQLRRCGRAAHQDGAQVRRRSPGRVCVEHAGQHRGNQRSQSDAMRGDPFREAARVESRRQRDAASRRQAASDDRQPADAGDRHAKEPAIVAVPAHVRRVRLRGGDERGAGEDRAARLPGRPGRVDDRRGVGMGNAAGALGGGQEVRALRRGELRVHEQRRNAHFQQCVQRDDRLQRVAAHDRIRRSFGDFAGKHADPRSRELRELGEGVRPIARFEAGHGAGVPRGGEDGERSVHEMGPPSGGW